MSDFTFLRGLDAYEVLGIAETASAEEIRQAHRRLIAKNHPDHAGSDLFAQLLNNARDVLLSDRASYDDWRRQQRSAPQTPPPGAPPPPPDEQWGTPGPRFVPTDGRPGYWAPPGAIPAPAPPPRPYPPSQPLGPPGSFGPAMFTGPMRALAEQAHQEMFATVGRATSPQQAATYAQSADLLAALRFYRVAVAAAFTDDLISAGLSDRPARFLQGFLTHIGRSPACAERDQALNVLRHIHHSPLAGVYVGLARLVIERHAGRA